MKYSVITLLTCLLTWAPLAMADSVTLDEAETVAHVWTAYRLEAWASRAGYQLAAIEAYPNEVDPLCFLAHLDPNGFLILSADNEIEPIMAFSPSDHLSLEDLDNPLWSLLLEDLAGRQQSQQEMDHLRVTTRRQTLRLPSNPAPSRWSRLLNTPLPEETSTNGRSFKVTTSLSSVSDIRVEPFIDTEWGQGEQCSEPCYNYHIPSECVCGCAATAMAQLMAFYQHPKSGIGTHDFKVTVNGTQQTCTTRGGDGDGGAYLWGQMKDNPDKSCSSLTEANREAIGALCYDAAIAIETEFTTSSSGAYTDMITPALTGIFDYTNAVYGYATTWNLGRFLEAANPNLDAGRPVMLGIFNESNAGHAVLADGYGYDDETLYHHLNMGWNGLQDLWYNLPDIDDAYFHFTEISCYIYNVSPSSSKELVSGRVLDTSDNPISGAEITLTGDGSSRTATSNSVGIYWFEVSSYTEVTLETSVTGYDSESLTVTTGRSRDNQADSGNLWGCDFSLSESSPPTETYTLTINSTDGGSVTTPGEGTYSYDDGTLVTLTATADAQYHFVNWTGAVANATATATTITLTEDSTVTANFALDQVQYPVTIQSTTGGSTDQDGTHTLDSGDSLTIFATPETGYHFTGWSGDASGSTNPLTLTVTSALDITANFALDQCQVTVQSTDGGSTNQDGIQTISYGESFTITATPETGYHFTGWSEDASGSSNPLTLTVHSNLNIIANFASDEQLPLTLTLIANDGGSVINPGEGTFNYIKGDEVTIEAQAQSGYRFSHWSGSISTQKNPYTLTLSIDRRITANFEPITTYQLEVDTTAGGTLIHPNPMIDRYPSGTIVPLEVQTVDPATFVFLGWCGSAVEAGLVMDPTSPQTTLTLDMNCRAQARFLSLLETLYVDDNAPGDPGPNDLNVSDPEENGTLDHPLDSIQEAIEVADEASSIWVYPGTYQETLNFLGKNIDVNGLALSGMQDFPIVDANQCGTVVTFNQSEGPDASLTGMTLTGGLDSLGAAIVCDGTSPSIRHCLIVGNYCNDPNGAIIYCRDSNSLFDQCTLTDNVVSPTGFVFRLADCNTMLTNSILWEPGLFPVLTERGNIPQITYSTLTQHWPGPGNLKQNPLFVDSGIWLDPNDPTSCISGDYHLLSEAGYWHRDFQTWIYDLDSSPCIDAGDPNVLPLKEPDYNGDLVNQGAYGETVQASRSHP